MRDGYDYHDSDLYQFIGSIYYTVKSLRAMFIFNVYYLCIVYVHICRYSELEGGYGKHLAVMQHIK